jgi:hypothetical protein
MRYPINTMKEYEEKGWALQASGGGLVLGRSHEEGGIFCWIKQETDYVLEAEIEGYEYILNPGAAYYYQKIFDQFNKPKEHSYLSEPCYNPPPHIKVLDARGTFEPKHLLFELGHFAVVNKKSTSGYLETLEEMNNAVSYSIVRPDYAETVVHSRKLIIKRFFDQAEGFF